MYRLNNKYLFISVTLHALLFFLISLYLEFVTESPKLGNTQALLLNSYIYSGDFLQSQATAVKQTNIQQKKSVKLDKQALKKASYKNNKVETLANPIATNSISQGEQAQTLVALLHDAIQKEQQYPPSAQQMERQGRVTVAFTLLMDGNIEDLRIMSSSGTTSLDRAALAAVNQAAPFSRLTKFIQNAKEYQIDVVFELT